LTGTSAKNKAVFLDRDGVLNQLIQRDGSFRSPQKFEDFHIIDDAKDVINLIHEMGYLALVVSNQPDISRGKLKQSDLDKMTKVLFEELGVDDVYYCPHDDNNDTGCRKPAPGLLFTAQIKYDLDFNKSFMIGDTWRDVQAAEKARISMILLNKNYNQGLKNGIRVGNLQEAISIINNGIK
jgi:D-glycero-D-manno-heptose 1,7-bisphosphate phosphatase